MKNIDMRVGLLKVANKQVIVFSLNIMRSFQTTEIIVENFCTKV
jgi:hypothetical protein